MSHEAESPGSRSGYLGTSVTHYDGELSGIAQALKEAREVSMLAKTSYLGTEEAGQASRDLPHHALGLRPGFWRNSAGELAKTPAWPGPRVTEGSRAGRLNKEASILGHEAERSRKRRNKRGIEWSGSSVRCLSS